MSTSTATTEPTKSSSSTSATPWVERYRPKSLDDVSHQTEIVATLKNAVQTGRLPHLLLYGPPGSGKTSVALALCKQLWHPSQWKRRVLELNASDERGISVVRDKIKHFAMMTVGKAKPKSAASFFQKKTEATEQQEEEEDHYPNPPFKVIILDEADTVTPDAQAALRRIIEAHSRITRFILICNYVTRIIEPLASRCAKFRFQPLPPASMKQRLQLIAQQEGCKQEEVNLLDEILAQADGDMRRAVTTLQSVHALAAGGNVVDKEAIAEIAGLAPARVVDTLYQSLASHSYDAVQGAVQDVVLSGYSAQMLLSALVPKVVTDASLSERAKAEICIRIAEAEKNMMEGADEYLQLMTVFSLAVTVHAESQQQQQQAPSN